MSERADFLRCRVHEETLRADDAERALRDRERNLARVLSLADAWEREFGGTAINADLVVAVLRNTIRPEVWS